MKRITLLFLTLSLIFAVALPAAAAGGPHGRRAIQRRAQTIRRIRNHRMFIEDPARPILRATPAVQRIPPLPTPFPTLPDGLPKLQQPQLPVKIPVTPQPRIQPRVIKQQPPLPDWKSLSQRLTRLRQRFPELNRLLGQH